MNPILLAVIIVTVIGVIGAVILVAASILMYVPVDERVEQITGVLAGANCGACGCAGCADYAKSIVEDGAPINKCTPGGAACAAAIAQIMGVEAKPNAADRRLVLKWQDTFQYDVGFIFTCAAWAAGKDKPMAYLDKILADYKDKGISTPESSTLNTAGTSYSTGETKALGSLM